MKKVFWIFLLLFSTLTSKAQFAGGSGTEKSPYLVSDAYQLSDVRNYPNSYFKQINDIDLSEWISDNSPRQGWAPINGFNGTYDGGGYVIKGLEIYRSTSNNIGLFGDNSGSLNNIVLQGAVIEGANNVGFICGLSNATISGCVVNGGKLTATDHVGGIVGSSTADIEDCYVFAEQIVASGDCGGVVGNTLHSVSRNYVYANITSSGNAGGVVGYSYYYDAWRGYSDPIVRNGKLSDCRYDGNIFSTQNSGGIIGLDGSHYYNKKYLWLTSNEADYTLEEGLNINNCLVGPGSIKSENTACGIVYRDGPYCLGYQTSNSICTSSIIEGFPSFRIQNVSEGYKNIASMKTILITNGNSDENIEDNDLNGVAYGEKTLYRSSTYTGLSWDMANTWAIEEGQSLPYLRSMSTPPSVSSYTVGGKCIVRGKCSSNGYVTLFKKGNVYTSQILDGNFEINIGAVNIGDTIYYNAVALGKKPSVIKYFIAEEHPEPEIIMGDSNSDGVVDAVDVVGTINYILGKPSSSFNQQNADVNKDGQILVDDAVGTVNVIMNNQ